MVNVEEAELGPAALDDHDEGINKVENLRHVEDPDDTGHTGVLVVVPVADGLVAHLHIQAGSLIPSTNAWRERQMIRRVSSETLSQSSGIK